jgi:hypothetical protein
MVSYAPPTAPSIVSPPIPVSSIPNPAPNFNPGANDYWNNPYYMAAYQQYQSQNQNQPQQGQPQIPQAYAAQYYQAYANYYQQQQGQQFHQQSQQFQQPQTQPEQVFAQTGSQREIPKATEVVEFHETAEASQITDAAESLEGPLMIPPRIDPRTNKMIPGTIFTVQDLERSLEEIRSEIKRYCVRK